MRIETSRCARCGICLGYRGGYCLTDGPEGIVIDGEPLQ